MKKTCISRDWLLMAPGAGAYQKVDLPNDYSVTMPRDASAPGGASNGFFHSGTGCYVKYWTAEETPRHYILDVDGAYMCASVYLNEYQLTMHPHGYSPFLVDLTNRIKQGKVNKLAISTNALQPSTRWYAGAGLYRDVFLWTGGAVRVEPRDVFVTTPTLDQVHVQLQVTADQPEDITAECTILDAEGKAVATCRKALSLGEGKMDCEMDFRLEDAKCWEPGHPYLYTMRTRLSKQDQLLDADERTFGIRTISVDARQGFLLNGKPFKMRGGCIHHDHGVLGSADYPAACHRKLTLLQEAGFNAIRTAHNPPSLQLLEQCDRMGILVMDEFFDVWHQEKGGQMNYHLWFYDWWQRDIASSVLRDRDHPCVISYSVGNEVPESDGKSDGGEWTARMAEETRKWDSTRLISSSIWGLPAVPEALDEGAYLEDFKELYHTPKYPEADQVGTANWAGRTEDYFAPLDICGYNYLYYRYELDHRIFPNRVIWGSETQALRFYDSWQETMKNPHVIGDFTWTAYDNMGEAGTGKALWNRDGVITGIRLAEYPWRTCYQGDLDLCGYRRPQSYFREAVWLGNGEPKIFTTHPEHYGEGFTGTGWHWYDVLDSWTFDDRYLGKPVKCEVYTDAEEIEWFCNGRSLGRSKPEKAIAVFDIPYEKGEISVIAYRNGAAVGSSSLKTVGAAEKIHVVPECEEIAADNRDLCYFRIYVEDAQGDRIPDAKTELTCLVDGGELLGIFSGDPANEDVYGSNRCHAFEGRAVAVVRTRRPGTLTLRVGARDLESGVAQIRAKA